MCVYIAIIATILIVMLWHMNSAAALKCNGYWLESLEGHLEKGSVQGGGLVCEYTGSVDWGGEQFFKINH